MVDKNKANGLTLKKTTLRILNEQEVHRVAGGEALPTVVDLPISYAYTTIQTTTANTTRPRYDMDTGLIEGGAGDGMESERFDLIP